MVGKKEGTWVKWFSELNKDEVGIAGGKGASLAEMYNNKFPVPPGFVVTADAYSHFLKKNDLDDKIKNILENLDIENTVELNEKAKSIRELMVKATIPADLSEEIEESYEILDVDKKKLDVASGSALDILKTSHEEPFVAVRSSATAEDLADASFAGQQESFLNVKGSRELLKKVKRCFASLFTARATYYREKKGFSHIETKLAVVVQRMIDSEKSGVMFSSNPMGVDDNIVIEAVFGLGEGIVSGRVKPDNYIVSREFKINEVNVAEKKEAIVRDSSGENKIVKLNSEKSMERVLNNHDLIRMAQFAVKLEEHYGKPQDIEFALEGGEYYIVQSRPVTTHGKEKGKEISGKVLLSGLPASPGVGAGKVRIVHDLNELDKVAKGDILVTKMTNPDMVVSMAKASGIVTDEGGQTSHAAIVSREMGIPAVVGTGDATSKLKDGQLITVDGSSGRVIEGRGEVKMAEVKPVVPTKTKIKVIVDLPDYASRAAASEVTSVGLTRIEGLIASSGKHPLYYVNKKNMSGYIENLVKGLKKIAEPFNEIWIRSSDIRTDEYSNLEGAPKSEEGNPMMGDHGIRFSLRHPEIIEAEFESVKEVADEFPDKKIGLMIPLVVNLDELEEAKRIAGEIGMPRNVKLGVMVETPAAVWMIKEICEIGIDFISFGTNDLTQFTLAIDRNNEEVQYLYNEGHPAVLKEMAHVIRACKSYGVETSICGQAGSKPEIAKFLVKQGIDSISVNADAAQKISKIVAEIEAKRDGEKSSVLTDERIEVGNDEKLKLSNKNDSKLIGNSENKEKKIATNEGVGFNEGDEIPVAAVRVIEEKGVKKGVEELFSDQDIESVVLKELEENGPGDQPPNMLEISKQLEEEQKEMGIGSSENQFQGEEETNDKLDEDGEGEMLDSGEAAEFENYEKIKNKEEIPNLNDAIPVNSVDFDGENSEEAIEFENKKDDEVKPGESNQDQNIESEKNLEKESSEVDSDESDVRLRRKKHLNENEDDDPTDEVGEEVKEEGMKEDKKLDIF